MPGALASLATQRRFRSMVRDDDDETEVDIRSLGSYEGYELLATRQAPGGVWRVIAMSLLKDGDRTSAERSAFVVSNPLLDAAEKIMKERIDRLRRMSNDRAAGG
jgi:hypothetical protein